MRRTWLVALGLLLIAGCTHGAPVAQSPLPAPLGAAASAPEHVGARDANLRVMLSELASAKACGMIRGAFNGLRAAEHPDVVVGVLWVRECEITNVGAHVTFHIAGNGWTWVDQTKSKGGGSFTVRQYVRFSIATTIRGAIDIDYNRDAHVVTLWFTPEHAPDVAFKTIGDIDVDSEGVWSSVVGSFGTVFATSPEAVAVGAATSLGSRDLSAQFAQGMAVTLNLCTGLRRVQLGRPIKGAMTAANVGETQRVSVAVQPGGVMIIGPQIADDGMTLTANALSGAVRLTLVCAKQAEKVAAEYMAGGITSNIPVLGAVEVRATSKLRIAPTSCPVVVVVSPLDNAPARFSWERPTSEIAHSTGGALVRCPAAKTTR